ncbi:conserved protein of unknown function [Bradyrhizobium sp. ORS 285]|nr:conserved hypothetical protein [Bradyrhizobium sp. ORS 285]SMX61371.1 conserved protein of unknown function [Bradyrhizobium sp. ORS 285]
MCLFAWWLHVHGGKELFEPNDIKRCYDRLHLSQINIAMNLNRMADRKPADLMRERGMFKLARSRRTELDGKYGVHHSVIAVDKILTDLPAMVPNIEERSFLQEALTCYRSKAFRACIVMVWNLAYAHLLDWLLGDPNRLATFNTAITKRYPKKTGLTIAKYDDFTDELKEREVIEICNTANLINSSIFKILKDKLDRRNIVAHPSTVVVVQHQADDTISELVNNVVLALT